MRDVLSRVSVSVDRRRRRRAANTVDDTVNGGRVEIWRGACRSMTAARRRQTIFVLDRREESPSKFGTLQLAGLNIFNVLIIDFSSH